MFVLDTLKSTLAAYYKERQLHDDSDSSDDEPSASARAGKGTRRRILPTADDIANEAAMATGQSERTDLSPIGSEHGSVNSGYSDGEEGDASQNLANSKHPHRSRSLSPLSTPGTGPLPRLSLTSSGASTTATRTVMARGRSRTRVTGSSGSSSMSQSSRSQSAGRKKHNRKRQGPHDARSRSNVTKRKLSGTTGTDLQLYTL